MSIFKWGQDFDRSYQENKKVLEEGEEGWIENGGDVERCKWMVERKQDEEKMG